MERQLGPITLGTVSAQIKNKYVTEAYAMERRVGSDTGVLIRLVSKLVAKTWSWHP